MREDEAGVAQVIEFTASITILVIIFTAFFTALGFQASHYVDPTPRVTGKAISVTSYLMTEPGLVASSGNDAWELLPDDNLSDIDNDELVRFGLSTGDYGVLSYDKVARLGEINATPGDPFYRSVQRCIGLTIVRPGSGFVQQAYDINISVVLIDGQPVAEWGYPLDETNFLEASHTVLTRLVVLERSDGSRVAARLTVDLMPLL
ncbi:MAG: hypothetical protein L0Z54_01475 [Thermoplasmata archaeon]|nr:hypothetical protein [Thermoplasmata archaeon]